MTKLQRTLKPYGITTSTDLHKATGMSRQQASEIWTGKRNIGKKVALRISASTGCPPAALMFNGDCAEELKAQVKCRRRKARGYEKEHG